MKTLTIEMEKIDLETKERKKFKAEVSNEKTEKHHIYSLTYEGFRSEWEEVK